MLVITGYVGEMIKYGIMSRKDLSLIYSYAHSNNLRARKLERLVADGRFAMRVISG